MVPKSYTFYKVYTFLLVALLQLTQASRVSEFSDRIIQMKKEGQWYIMFYAPWCGHCKRLDPIWNHVAQGLHKTNIRVGKVDCTRFPAVADEFGVTGYPTIIFFKEDLEFIFRGDRTKEELMNFALRLTGPPVQRITKPESIAYIKATNDLFFVFVGDCEGPQWEAFFEAAEKFQPHGFFYCASKDLMKDHVTIKSDPTIFVYKENTIYFYEGQYENESFNASLHDWVNEERFKTFPKVTRGNLHQFYEIKKNLVLVVVEENKLEEVAADMLEFRDMVESVIRTQRVRYHKHFQFGWVGSPDLANSIAMSILPLPHLIVVNSTTRHHHLPEDEPSQLTPQALTMFLDQIHNQSAPVFGGNSWWVKLYSLYFEGKTTLKNMWYGNPALTAVILGFPLGFLTLICYSICCSDIMDAEDDEDG